MTTATIIYNASDIETAQPVSVADIVKQTKERGSKFFTLHSIPANAPTRSLSLFTIHYKLFTLSAIYRRQLRMYRNIAQFIDHHPTLTNLWLGGWIVAAFLYVTIHA